MFKSWVFDHTSTTLQPCGLPSVINIEQQSQSCVLMFQLNLLMFVNAFFNLDNIIVKRWTTSLSIVGQYLCQTLDNTFVKRCTTYLSNVRQYLFQTLKIPFSSVRQQPLQILDNNLDKRLKTPLSNYDLQIPISFISMRYLLFLMDKQ